MALRFIDGCDHYTTVLYKWDSQGIDFNISIGNGRFAGNALASEGTLIGDSAKRVLPSSAAATHVFGAAVKVLAFGTSGVEETMTMQDDVAALTARLSVNSSGAITLDTNLVTAIATSATGLFTANNYHYLELVVFVDSSVGFIQGWLDNVKVVEATGINTLGSVNASNPFSEMVIHKHKNNDTFFDDMYVLDSLTAINNARLGDVRVDTIYPSSEGDSVQFTPSAGSDNSQMVDELIHDDDATFVESGGLGTEDLYNMDASIAGTIFGVQPLILSKKTDVGTIEGTIIAKKGGTTFQIFGDSITADYKYTQSVMNTDPTDSSAWTNAKVDATQFGMKITDKDF